MSKPKLALIPSGYKSGKVYSILPNDATGDFDFERQSIGTRVRKDGLIEEAKTSGSITNLLIYSEQIDQWTQSSISTSTDQTLAPNGTNTADKIIENTATTSHKVLQSITTTNGTPYTYSVYLKSDTRSKVRLNIFGSYAEFDTTNKSVITLSGITDYKIESLSNGWGRYSITKTANSTSTLTYVYLLNNSGSVSYTGDGTSGLFIWGAMLSEGALSDYIKTEGSQETKTVETFTDVPRLDWYNSNCPSLLLEPQRSNLFSYSEDASQWNTARGTTTSNNIIAPNGELVGNLYEKTEDANEGYVYRNLTVSSVGTYSVSVFFKYNNSQYVHFLLWDGSSNGARVWFDIQNGVVGTSASFGITFTASDFNIENYGNGWYRCSAKYVVTGTDTTWQFRVSPSGSNGVNNTDSGAKFYFFGAQIEQGSYPTSYIKTEASTITRLKDECINGGDSDLFDIAEGTFFVDVTPYINSSSNHYISLNDGGSSDRFVFIFQSYGTQVRLFGVSGGSNFLSYYQNITFNERNKLAVTFKENEFKFYLNGSLVHTDTSGSMPTGLNQLDFSEHNGNRNFEGKVHDTRVYDRVLTEAEAIELTK